MHKLWITFAFVKTYYIRTYTDNKQLMLMMSLIRWDATTRAITLNASSNNWL